MSLMGTILRAASRLDSEPLNILGFPTHERAQSNLAHTGHNFYLFHGQGIKTWNTKYAAVPSNFTLLDGSKGWNQLPQHIDFDLILCESNGGQFQATMELSQKLGLPVIKLEHTTPPPGVPPTHLLSLKQQTANLTKVFITEYSQKQWLDEDGYVIKHGIDDTIFYPDFEKIKEKKILTVANEYNTREPFLGWPLYQQVIQGLPARPVGDTKGFSEPAKDVNQLREFYQTTQVFLNTSAHSPVPISLLEAMACGMPIVSTNNCAIPEFVEHGVNGYLTNDAAEMRECLKRLLSSPETCITMGKKSVEIIREKCAMSRYVDEWNTVLRKVAP